jgi:hypothetical protein
LIECASPYLRSEPLFFDSDTFNRLKIPMFILDFGFVILYQVYQKRKSERLELQKAKESGSIAKMAEILAKKSGTKLSSKAKVDLGENENMEKQLKGLSKSVEGMKRM